MYMHVKYFCCDPEIGGPEFLLAPQIAGAICNAIGWCSARLMRSLPVAGLQVGRRDCEL